MFEWDEKYSVGVLSIDNQHKEILSIMGRLLDAMKKGQASEISAGIIHELEKYAASHFQKEEFFFHRFNYIGLSDHIIEHQNFKDKIRVLKSDLHSGKITLSFELLNFLKDWIDHHILVIDKAYSECFRLNGLK
jgi:methyl-accepting chemotaxis protein/hemerythrin